MNREKVAVVGASQDRKKFGNKSVRAHVAKGFDVFPVNPREETIEGLRVYRSVLDIPGELARITVYVPPSTTLELLDEFARKGCGKLYLNPGSESAAVVEKAQSLGLNPLLECSIVAIGDTPRNYP